MQNSKFSFFVKLIKHPFFAGSAVMLLGSNLYNLGQFIYHFLAGRILGKVYYGDLAAIISILGLFSIVQGALGLTIVKYVASEKNSKKLTNFISFIFWTSFWVGAIVATLTLITAPFFIKFLNLADPNIYFLLAPILFFYIMAHSGRSILQGLLKFERYIVSLLIESITKISLIFVFGAMLSLLLGIMSSFLVIAAWLSSYLKFKVIEKPKLKPIFKYSLSVFIQGLALTSMYSTDLLLVKHFFPQDQASIYASLAVLGRVVFFGISPITQVMFPLIAKRYENNQSYLKILYLSLTLTMATSFFVVLIYRFFPNFIIGITFSKNFIEGAPILWWFGLFMAFLSLAMLLTQFYLSIGKTKVVWMFVLAALLQIFLIWFIHPNLLTVIQLSILSAALLVLGLFVYFLFRR